MMRTLSPLIAVLLIVVLSGCGTFEVSSQRMQFSLAPDGNLGYEIDSSGVITIKPRTLRFTNAPGASALQVTRAEVNYYDAAGNPIVVNDPTVPSSFDIYVPAGIACDDPDEVLGCTMNSTNPRVAASQTVETAQTYQMLEAEIAFQHASTGAVGWYAEFVFHGFTGGGFSGSQVEFTSAPYRVAIVAPN